MFEPPGQNCFNKKRISGKNVYFDEKSKAPAKRVQHFIQHHATLMFNEMLHSFGHLVVSCCIFLYEAVIAIKLFD